MTLTAEPGVIGGVPAGGLNFGAAINAQAIIDQPYQFDFYDGGGLDVAFLGLAQADREGNLNVSRSSARGWPAPAASSTSARTRKKVVFVGTFTAGGLEVAVDGRQAARSCSEGDVAQVRARGRAPHLLRAACAPQRGQPVLYVTERCVFRLTRGGPGADRDRARHRPRARHPRRRWTSRPIVARPAADGRAHLPRRADGAARRHAARCPLDAALHATTRAERALHQLRAARGQDAARRRGDPRARCERDLRAARATRSTRSSTTRASASTATSRTPTPRWCKDVVERYYVGVTRYTTSAFLRVKLGDALREREVAPHIFESEAEARATCGCSRGVLRDIRRYNHQ